MEDNFGELLLSESSYFSTLYGPMMCGRLLWRNLKLNHHNFSTLYGPMMCGSRAHSPDDCCRQKFQYPLRANDVWKLAHSRSFLCPTRHFSTLYGPMMCGRRLADMRYGSSARFQYPLRANDVWKSFMLRSIQRSSYISVPSTGQ